MKIGDKVRFLNEVGGGVVSGFQGKHTVLVEDKDGFDIPMPIDQVVVVDTDNYNIPKAEKKGKGGGTKVASNWDDENGEFVGEEKPAPTSLKAQLSGDFDDDDEEEDWDPSERPVTFKATPLERKGADVQNLTLCFVPTDVKRVSSSSIKTYFVNESNYYVQVLYMHAQGENWAMRFNGVVPPNGKVFVETLEREDLNDLEYVCVQTLAWKEGKSFTLKPALTTEIKLDCTKFYKLHSFHASQHFDTPTWEVPVVRDDKSVRALFVDAEKLQTAMLSAAPQKSPKVQEEPTAPRTKKDSILEIDLHIDKLLDTAAGMSNADILLYQMKEFRRVMDENLKHTGKKIVFIHGKGDGVLRRNLLQELKYRYKKCTWQDASFREYGYGATQVTIQQ